MSRTLLPMHAKFALISLFFVGIATHADPAADFVKLKAFANQVLELKTETEASKALYLILRDNKQVTGYDTIVAQGDQTVTLGGLCFSETGVCSATSSMRTLIEKMLARSSGRTKVQDYVRAQFDKNHDQQLIFATKLIEVTSDEITADLDMTFVGTPVTVTNRVHIKRSLPFLNKSIEIRDLVKDESIRKSLSQVGGNFQKLRSAVFKIKTADNDTENLLGASIGHGTGFFISTSGVAITNHHVISSADGCLTNLECELKIAQVDSEGKEQTYQVQARLLTAHKGYDVAVIQIQIPAELSITALEIEDRKIGGDIVTFGFPGDRSEHAEGPLTFAFGELLGFQTQAFSTSAYIMGGASGSPVVNAANGKVIGLLSNGSGQEEAPGQGMPGIARPFDLINQLLGIDGYASGKKQKTVKVLLTSLESSLYPDAAAGILSRLSNERTYLGVERLSELLVSHPSVSVREEIKQYLKRSGFLGFK